MLNSSRLTDWESQQVQHRLTNPFTIVPNREPARDLSDEKVRRQDTATVLKTAPTLRSERPALEDRPEDEAAVVYARQRLQEYADTAGHDDALSHPAPNLEDLEYRRSV